MKEPLFDAKGDLNQKYFDEMEKKVISERRATMLDKLEYNSKNGGHYQVTVKAAQLVPNTLGSAAHLPPRIGDIPFIPLTNPKDFGLQERHPIHQLYPNLKVLYFAMVIKESFMVERNEIKGVSLYYDWNGSSLSCEILSENGRNGIAPYPWSFTNENAMTNPSAHPELEWRRVEENGQTYIWQNSIIHGWCWEPWDRSLDWKDGIPVNVKDMYDREYGRVRQSIFVPKEVEGLGTAEQTLPGDIQTQTLSMLLFFPRKEVSSTLQKNLEKAHLPCPNEGNRTRGSALFFSASSDDDDYPGTLSKGIGSDTERSLLRGGPAMRSYEEKVTVAAEFKMAAGGEIKQHIIRNPFSAGFWDLPEALLVCLPVSEEQAKKILVKTGELVPGRRTF